MGISAGVSALGSLFGAGKARRAARRARAQAANLNRQLTNLENNISHIKKSRNIIRLFFCFSGEILSCVKL